MDQLITNLSNTGARAFLYVPGSLNLGQTILQVINQIIQMKPDTEILIATLGKNQVDLPNVSNFQIAQITQVFLDIFFGLGSPRPVPSRILIIEASSNLGQFFVPQKIGHILVLGSPFKSMNDLTETSRFLSGETKDTNITPLHVAIYLGQIGYQVIAPEFIYQGNPVTINMTPIQYNEYLQRVTVEKALDRKEPFSALQALNMIYPPNLQILHNLSRDQRPNITPDLPLSEEGWISHDILDTLPRISPKINWLIQYLRINPGKHVVYTAFNESNGVQAISSFLRLSGFSVINITGNDRQQIRSSKIVNFNQLNTQVILISNLYASVPIYNVTSFIMFEQHPSDAIFYSYLRALQSMYPAILHVVFLISIGPQSESTLDIENYIYMANQINQVSSILEILCTGKIDSSQILKYQQVFGIPDLSADYLINIFKDLKFKPITLL